jgi:hypothetical protein
MQHKPSRLVTKKQTSPDRSICFLGQTPLLRQSRWIVGSGFALITAFDPKSILTD